jgi:hypothetical protein
MEGRFHVTRRKCCIHRVLRDADDNISSLSLQKKEGGEGAARERLGRGIHVVMSFMSRGP